MVVGPLPDDLVLAPVPTAEAAPAPAASSGFGGFFSGLGQIAQLGFGIFSERESAKEARNADRLAAERAFELEKLRIDQGILGAPPPLGPVQRSLNALPLAPGLSPPLLLGGLALLAVVVLMRRG